MAALPHPGQLRHTIRIVRTVNSINERGYPVREDRTVLTCRASVDDASTGWVYRLMADTQTPQFDRIFCIRHRDGIEEGMYVIWQEKKHLIVNIERYDYKNRWLQLRCRRQEARDDDPQDTEEDEEDP